MRPETVQIVYQFWQQLIPSNFDTRFYEALTIGTILAILYFMYKLVLHFIDWVGG